MCVMPLPLHWKLSPVLQPQGLSTLLTLAEDTESHVRYAATKGISKLIPALQIKALLTLLKISDR